MADYVKVTDFAAKDTLPSGNPAKVVRGSEIDSELVAVQTAITSKVNNTGNETIAGIKTFTGNVVLGGTAQVLGNFAVGSTAPLSNVKAYITQGADMTLGTDYALFVAGAGYSGGIALNATSMQIGQNSSSRSLTFHSGTGWAERMRIDATGNVGIGTASPLASLSIAKQTTELSGTGNPYALYAYPTASGICNIEAITSSSGITQLCFRTYNNGTYNSALVIDGSGNVRVTNNTGGLGYGTGAGGTVTQATSKSTAVTLNRPTGQITMNNAALAAGASISFAVNNSLVTTSDVVVANAVNTSAYVVNVLYTLAGQFGLRITNVSGGSLSDAVPINFAVIKGATA